MSLRRLLRLSFAAMLVVAFAAPAAAQSDETATITVVHAVPGEAGFPADIYLNDQLVVRAMVFEAVSDPVEVPAGQVDVALFASGADPMSAQPLLDQKVTLDAGRSYTAVAQLLDESPAIALYVNDLDPVDTGETRLTFRHTGSEGPLQVAVDGETLVADLMSPNEVTVELPAGMHPLLVATEDGSTLVERDLDFRAGSLLVLYTVGSSGDESFALLTQQVTTPQVSPAGVPTGTAGLRAEGANTFWVLLPLALVAGSLLAIRPKRSAG